MDKSLAELIRISNIVGSDVSLVQGGGGNTSVKTDDGKFMYIKASGTALKDMNNKMGWRRLGLDAVLGIIQDKALARLDVNTREVEVVNRLALSCDDNVKTGARPSVEAHLHALLDKCIIHLHPNAVGAYVNAKGGKAAIEKLFKDEKYPPVWVGYADPGLMLATKIARLVDSYKKTYGRGPSVLFLEKHGLFVSANSGNSAVRIVRKVIKLCSSKLKDIKAAKVKAVDAQAVNDAKLNIRRGYFEATGRYDSVNFFVDKSITGFMAKKDAKVLLAKGVLAPDELVYANGPAVWLDKCESNIVASKLKGQIAKGDKPAVSFVVKGLGLFVIGKEKTASIVRDIAVSSFFIRINSAKMSGINSLNKRQCDFINNWEAEAFRKSVAGGDAAGQLKDRVAIVTGAGSGLGRSIAIGLARAGAIVGLADIDVNGAEETKELIEKELPGSVAAAVRCNVTDETSVDEAFDGLLNKWGGLDILVNAAGVAPAFSLVDLPVDKWRFALEVNLTGYFLMARAAARIMIQQGMGGSIVNISSKSGIDASKNNTPYNATKAGELHMSRGWAMELGEYGIRVNSVCPGNVFEGSKIWNPQYIKTCAKKYGIAPDEVIPYYVGKTMLNREIKGQDIADSVVFLASDNSRRITAQTIVTDAGQAVVR